MTTILLFVIYISFISLGLPDSILGSAWPTMYQELDVPVSYAGIIAVIIAFGTIVSSLQSDRLTLKLGPGKVTAISVVLTAFALFGFSISSSFLMLCLFAIPYGLGAGSVDACLNNYVALHYKGWHMSLLHCMWGVGAVTGPNIMAYALTNNKGWNSGYYYISMLQIGLTAILLFSLPLWKKRERIVDGRETKSLSLREVVKIKGVKEVLLCFLCYCGVEQSAGLWASSYLNMYKGVPAEEAARYASMFFIGITVGRGLNAIIALKLKDRTMVRIGLTIIAIGIIVMIIPASSIITLIGLILIGLGCAPIYPSLIHATPDSFGEDKSQAVIGIQMAFAYIGVLALPPLFGFIADFTDISLLPVYITILFVVMLISFERLQKKIK
ncbi:MFS transporter [Spirochaetales bacterium NM-380-WT-3C1]|uniref:MFS transporter n=1 Tax=Bullifex porci TaxID=2606638 RepID=A0A7X2PDC0_9SPIO|nr:MFS transporter [Bullifex porci]MSU06763.1 MFS transporter [Bullifex porci]